MTGVKQIEIVKGPGSCLYGTDAFMGVINIIPKSPEDRNFITTDILYGSFATTSKSLSFGKKGNNWGICIDVSYFDTAGAEYQITKDVLYGTHFTLAPSVRKPSNTQGQNSLFFEINNLSLNVIYYDRKKELNLAGNSLALVSERIKSSYIDSLLQLKYNIKLGENLTITPKISYEHIKNDTGGMFYPAGLMGDYNFDGYVDSQLEYWPDGVFWGDGYTNIAQCNELLFDWTFKNKENRLIVGLLYEKHEGKNVYLKMNMHPIYFYNTGYMMDMSNEPWMWKAKKREISGIYVQDEWDITQNWYLTIGGRYDNYSDVGESFNPRVSIIWKKWEDKNIVIKGIYSSAFKSPSLSDISAADSHIKPEKLKTYEVDISCILFNIFFNEIGVYKNITSDLISLSSETKEVSPGVAIPVLKNLDENETLGVEYNGKWILSRKNNNSYIYGSYTYNDAKDLKTNKTLKMVPKIQFGGGINLNIKENYNWNINVKYIGESMRENGDTRPNIPSSTIVNTSFGLKIVKCIDFFLAAENLFNKEKVGYSWVSTLPADDCYYKDQRISARIQWTF